MTMPVGRRSPQWYVAYNVCLPSGNYESRTDQTDAEHGARAVAEMRSREYAHANVFGPNGLVASYVGGAEQVAAE